MQSSERSPPARRRSGRLLFALHRWVGLATALFLTLAGLTGAIIAWEHELDSWLAPSFYYARSGPARADALDALQLADRVEREYPQARVSFLPLGLEPEHTHSLFVAGRTNPETGEPFELGFSQMAFDPNTGELQGSRLWGEPSLAPEAWIPFLYRFHFSLHLPRALGLETGILLMGLIAIAWVLDCFVALWISFPSRKSWRRSLTFRFSQGWPRLNFDLHRSGGVWVWPLLLVMAITAVSMNLGDQVVRPLVSVVSALSPDPIRQQAGRVDAKVEGQLMTRAEALDFAIRGARARGIAAPPGAIFSVATSGVYSVGFFEPGQGHADGRLANPWLQIDGLTGEVLSAALPGKGTAGDIFMQLQFPLHSGRLFGVVGRAAVSLLGLAIAVLGVTGTVLWARRRRRRARGRREAPSVAATPSPSPTESRASAVSRSPSG